jgi:hypothetical protein
MQAEAGQSLEVIVSRKELERAAGLGRFFWGVGTSLGPRLFELLRDVPRPMVLFSVMRAKPKRQDVRPDTVVLWTSYNDALGRRRRLPEHALVLSRGSTARGPKERHYALVCHSRSPLDLTEVAQIRLGHFRNWGSTSSRIGSSQVTAIVEHRAARDPGPLYGVELVAELADPYFVRLDDPVVVPTTERKLLEEGAWKDPDPAGWTNLVRYVRRRIGLS